MAQDFDELTLWWEDEQLGGCMDENAKRLLIFAPDAPEWNRISSEWGQVIHVQTVSRGLGGRGVFAGAGLRLQHDLRGTLYFFPYFNAEPWRSAPAGGGQLFDFIQTAGVSSVRGGWLRRAGQQTLCRAGRSERRACGLPRGRAKCEALGRCCRRLPKTPAEGKNGSIPCRKRWKPT